MHMHRIRGHVGLVRRANLHEHGLVRFRMVDARLACRAV